MIRTAHIAGARGITASAALAASILVGISGYLGFGVLLAWGLGLRIGTLAWYCALLGWPLAVLFGLAALVGTLIAVIATGESDIWDLGCEDTYDY
jgi:hypothetical protein